MKTEPSTRAIRRSILAFIMRSPRSAAPSRLRFRHPRRGGVPGEVITMEAFVSTGTRFNDRTVLDSLVPIDIVNVKDMTLGGLMDLGSMLAASIPSVTFPPITAAGDASFARPIRMRGLASNEALILVNGQRLYQSAWKA